MRSASDTGILYGSVTTRDISNLIGENGITVNRKQIALDKPIKELGIFDVSVILHPEVESKIKLRVVRSLGDSTPDTEDEVSSDDVSDEVNNKLNESLLEEGVSLKTDETLSDEVKEEAGSEDTLPDQS